MALPHVVRKHTHTNTHTNTQTTNVLERARLRQKHLLSRPKKVTKNPRLTCKQQLEERPLKLEETHLTFVQGHSSQPQTSRGALGCQNEKEEEVECDQCQARDDDDDEREREREVAAKINKKSRRESANDVE